MLILQDEGACRVERCCFMLEGGWLEAVFLMLSIGRVRDEMFFS
jgi:hypothetical protein